LPAPQPESVAVPEPRIRPAAIHDVPEIHHLLEIYAQQGNLLPRSMSELYRHLRDFFVVEVATGPSLDRDPRLGPIGEVATGPSLDRDPRLGPIGEVATGPSLDRDPRLGPIGEVATGPSLDRDPRLGPIGKTDGHVAGCAALEIFTDSLGELRSLVVADEHKGKGLGKALVERVVLEAKAIGLKRLMALTYVPAFFHKLGFGTVPKDTLPEKVWSVCVKCYKYNHCDETAVLLEW
jgi:N-acetylglutamate synthase-like GNAT family acetyltransferase